MSNKHGAVYALVPLAIMACSDPQAPAPRALGPASAVVAQASGEPTGIPGFHFLPPIARGTTSGGDRDASLLDLLAVEVCEWTGSACVQPVLQRLTSHDDPPARLELADDASYKALWKTRADQLDPARNYRVRVLASGAEIGHADVDVLAPGEKPSSDPAGAVQVALGSTLPIVFFVEKGTGARAGATGATIQLPGGVTLAIPPGALPQDVFFTTVPATNLPASNRPIVPGTAWAFGPDGLVFAKPVVMTIPYDPSAVPSGVEQSELRIHKLVNNGYEQQNAGLVNLVNHTVSAEVNGFSVYVIMNRDPMNPEDIAPPVVRAFEVRNASTATFGSSTTLDVNSADATLFTRIVLTDNISGVNWIDLRWLSPTGRQLRFPCYRGGAPDSGSDTNGEWLCTAVFPRYAEGGLWRADVVWIRDNLQNQGIYVNQPGGLCRTNSPLDCLTNVPQITVNSATPDIDPPVIQSPGFSLDVQPRMFGSSVAVDAGLGARRIWFGFSATDNLSGIGPYQPFEYFWVQLIGPNNQVVDFVNTCTRTQGTVLSGNWECWVDIPAQAQAGTWKLSRVRVPDSAGNGGWSSYADWVPNGSGQLCNRGTNCVAAPEVTVTSTGDGTPPILQSLTIQSPSPANVTTTLGITDNLSGVTFVRVAYTSTQTTQFRDCYPPRTAGTATNGTWECSITFSSLAARGQWVLSVEVLDVAGNRRYYSRRPSDGYLCYFDSTTNTQVCQDFGDTDLILQ